MDREARFGTTHLSFGRELPPPRSKRIALLAVSLVAATWLGGCGRASDQSKDTQPPANIENRVSEQDLTTVRLTPEAEARIGIELGEVESRRLTRTRQLGGELLVAPGSSATLTSPRAAVILAPEGGEIPGAGALVRQGEPLLRLVVLPAEGSQARAREELAVAEARLSNAKLRADRAEELLREGVGTAQVAEDAHEQLLAAEAVVATARAQLQVLLTGVADPNEAALTPITLGAPEGGVVRQVLITAGQAVPGGAVLLEIVRVDSLWVKVPVYVGDVSTIDPRAPAWVSDPGALSSGERLRATPLASVPMADPASSSADLFYSVSNARGQLRPGQRVSVTLSLTGADHQNVVPWSAVLHDVHGGTWVYEALGEHVYARRRVEVQDVVEGSAVLARGPGAGTKVVSVGAAELFSTEFGPAK